MSRKEFEERMKAADCCIEGGEIDYEYLLALVVATVTEKGFDALEHGAGKEFGQYMKQAYTLIKGLH